MALRLNAGNDRDPQAGLEPEDESPDGLIQGSLLSMNSVYGLLEWRFGMD